MNTIPSQVHIGVDVGKDQLDFFCHETAEHFTVANSPSGIRQALRQLSVADIACLVVEATGRYEQALVQAAHGKGIPVVIAQPIAIQHNPVIRRFYRKLVANGKVRKVAVVARMRKMIVMLNAMVRDETCWENSKAAA